MKQATLEQFGVVKSMDPAAAKQRSDEFLWLLSQSEP